jgi:2-polyprenyl-3-methyl-5-hydroxy-6-metoxy-1,4-benzoquinol methylase
MNGRIKGSPAAREVWERQYRSGGWDYLAADDEAAHYLAIVRFYQRHLPGGSVLDIGCGAGILAARLQRHAGMPLSRYTGIDLSEEAILRAAASFPEANWHRLDYGADAMPGRYDGVIFNETLYFFDDPIAILDKSIADNMHGGSLLIISMYGEHHEALWQAMATRGATVDEEVVENSRGVRWKIRTLRPNMNRMRHCMAVSPGFDRI